MIKKQGYEAAEHALVEIIPLADYIAVLRFRESELRRVLAAYDGGDEAFKKANQ